MFNIPERIHIHLHTGNADDATAQLIGQMFAHYEDRIMSKLSSLIANAKAQAQAAIARVNDDVAMLKGKIDALQAKLDAADTVSPEDEAAMAELTDLYAKLDPDPDYPPVELPAEPPAEEPPAQGEPPVAEEPPAEEPPAEPTP